jgi:hypothetical protein
MRSSVDAATPANESQGSSGIVMCRKGQFAGKERHFIWGVQLANQRGGRGYDASGLWA